MMGLGWQELVIVLVIITIIFGAGKLPDVARSFGQGVKEFKEAFKAFDPPGIPILLMRVPPVKRIAPALAGL